MYLRSMTRLQAFQAQLWVFVAAILLGLQSVSAQVNQFTAALTDTSRANRVIGLDIRVPSEASEVLPWVVFGHGFVMPTTDYDDLATALATAGYAVFMVETEVGFLPSHEDFGMDLAYVVENASSDLIELEGVLGNRVALMGHSMGGGAAWLAASQLGEAVHAVIGLAPAETSPSAIEAGPDIVAPVMVISGSNDLITPPSEHHEPLYTATSNSNCRVWINLVDGGHCGFADDGTLCDIGELVFNGMSRPEQQNHSIECIRHWLNAHLQNDDGALVLLQDYAMSEVDVELALECQTSAVDPSWSCERFVVGPNPATNVLKVPRMSSGHSLQAFDVWGRELPVVWLSEETLDISSWPRGTAVLRVQSPSEKTISRSKLLVH